MTEALIGRLERVDLRTVWVSESSDFTPWLALPENLTVLKRDSGCDDLGHLVLRRVPFVNALLYVLGSTLMERSHFVNT